MSASATEPAALLPLAKSLAWACSPIPLLLCVLVVIRTGENVPFFDQWDGSAPVALAAVRGELGLADLLAQHNEHRVFFTHVVTAALALTTHWNLVIEMFVGLALGVANLLWVGALLRTHGMPIQGPHALLLAALFLAPSHRWTWGFLSQWQFMIFFLLAALFFARREPPGWRPLLLATGCAACASFSFGAGMLVWAILPPLLWGLSYRRAAHFAVLGAAAVLTLALYFHGYDFYFTDRSADARVALFALAFLGGAFLPLDASPILAIVLGAGGIALFACNLLWLRAREVGGEALAIWLGLAGFALALALTVAGGRLVLGLQAALAARYVAAASLFWVALAVVGRMVLAELRSREARSSRWLGTANLAALVVLSLFYLHANASALSRRLPPTRAQAECVRAFPVAREAACLRGLLPGLRAPELQNPEQRWLYDTIDDLARHRLAIFAEAPAPSASVALPRRPSLP